MVALAPVIDGDHDQRRLGRDGGKGGYGQPVRLGLAGRLDANDGDAGREVAQRVAKSFGRNVHGAS